MCGVTDWNGCVRKAGASALEAMANAIADATAWIVVESFTWWIDTSSSGLNEGVVGRIRDVTWPLTLTVAAAGMIVLGIKMAATGRADPLLSAGESIARLVVWTISGVLILNTFMKYAAAFSGWVLSEAKTRELGARLSGAYGDTDISLGAVLLLSLIGFLAGIAQWLIGLFREAGVVILAGCIPLAASGNFLGQSWERRIVGWCLALIWWQPCAALVYMAAFAMLEEARGGQDILVGITMLLIAVAALPALLRLFSWMTEQHGQGKLLGSGGGALKGGAAVMGARMSVTAMTRMVRAGLPRAGGNQGGDTSGTPGDSSGGTAGGQPSGAAPGQRTATPQRATHRDTGRGALSGGVPASRTGGSDPGRGPADASPARGGGGMPAGTSGAGAAGAGTATAAGAKGAALGGPVGAAAATAGTTAAAGARAAGDAMTKPPAGAAEGAGAPKPGSKEDTS